MAEVLWVMFGCWAWFAGLYFDFAVIDFDSAAVADYFPDHDFGPYRKPAGFAGLLVLMLHLLAAMPGIDPCNHPVNADFHSAPLYLIHLIPNQPPLPYLIHPHMSYCHHRLIGNNAPAPPRIIPLVPLVPPYLITAPGRRAFQAPGRIHPPETMTRRGRAPGSPADLPGAGRRRPETGEGINRIKAPSSRHVPPAWGQFVFTRGYLTTAAAILQL